MPVIDVSIPAVLRERASLQPTDAAFTFMNYQLDPAGVAQSLTWAQVHRRAGIVARALAAVAATGGRAVILAPQGLDYVVGFLGALQAGLIAVPLTIPFVPDDEHVQSVVRDSAPEVILTTSAIAGLIGTYAVPLDGRAAPALIEIDRLDPDAPNGAGSPVIRHCDVAYLQYTSGSTRRPAGVVVSHRNVVANFEQVMANYFADTGNVAPPDTTVVSWVPLAHNMGIFIGVCASILAGLHTVFTGPLSFVQRPARWMQLLGSHPRAFTPTPNFALELVAQTTTDADLAGLDLGGVHSIVCGGERIHPATLGRFADRFARANLSASVLRPSYGLAEATVYVATRAGGAPPEVVHFEPAELSAGRARRCAAGGTALVSYGVPGSPAVRIVAPETGLECPTGAIGEIWVHGDNVAAGYWGNPEATERTFGARLAAPSAGTPDGPWLRTGDLGALVGGELFIMGRTKDLLIVRGRNHYPDDIEATIQGVTGGRSVAISVADDDTEKLVVVVELEMPGAGADELRTVLAKVTAAISTAHGLGVDDLVPVAPGAIPSTTSGKVRRAASAERYRNDGFTRLAP